MTENKIYNSIFDDDIEAVLDLDVRTEIRFSSKEHMGGKMVPVSVEGKEEYIIIPLNIKNGDTIKVDGKGKHNPRSGKTGDLYVLVHIEDKPILKNQTLLIVLALIAVICVSMVLLIRKPTKSKLEPTSPVIEYRSPVIESTSPVETVFLTNCANIDDSNEQGSTTDVNTGNWEDSAGIMHKNSLRFWVSGTWGYSNTEYIVYKLNEDYKKMEGSISLDPQSASDATAYIKVYVDGRLLEISQEADKKTSVSFSVNVEGVDQLRIECITDSTNDAYCIVDALLYYN